MTKQVISYTGLEQPDVEVLVDGVWHPGQLREWAQADDESWSAMVTYTMNVDGFPSTFGGRFAAEMVRVDPLDRSRGRG